MSYLDLNKGEKFVYEWQYEMSGSFSNGLAELICKADTMNRALLAEGFPDEVDAVERFLHQKGYWEYIKEKAGE